MSRKRSLEYYPQIYEDMLRKVMLEESEQVIPLSSTKDGIKIRGQFYAFVQTLRAEAERLIVASVRRQLTTRELDIVNLARLSGRIMVSLQEQPGQTAQLVFTDRNNSWQAQTLLRAVSRPLAPAPRLTEKGEVTNEKELATIALAVTMMDEDWPNTEEFLFEMREQSPELFEKYPKLEEAAKRFAARHQRSPEEKAAEEILNARSIAYGVNPAHLKGKS